MQPDVTLLIAAFNAQNTIGRAIQSALCQRDVTVEVVVADDCSTDGTVGIARAFPTGQVRVVELDRNRGPGGARNAGLDVARGRWIAMLDADDAVYPDRLSRLLRLAEAKGAQIVVDNLDVVNEPAGSREPMFPEARLRRFSELTLADFVAANLLFAQKFSFGYMKPVIERDFLERNALRYVETLRIGEDYLFLASALAKGGRCVVEPRPGYAYSVLAGSISRVLELGHVEAMLEADRIFLARHTLDSAAAAAQARRTRSLEEAASFLALVQHLKARQPLKAVAAALRDPVALRHLRMPIAARLRRMSRTPRSPAYGNAE